MSNWERQRLSSEWEDEKKNIAQNGSQNTSKKVHEEELEMTIWNNAELATVIEGRDNQESLDFQKKTFKKPVS